MHILASVNLSSVYVHFGFRKCTFMEAKMCIYKRKNVHIQKRDSVYVHLRKENKNAHLWKLSSIYVHFAFRIHAFMEAKMRIYESSLSYIQLPYMRIYEIQNAHIQKIVSVYTHFGFRKCAYMEAKMRIYESSLSLSYMRILASVYAHLWKEKMRIYGSQNAHIQKRAFVYLHFGFYICTFAKSKLRIYGRELS
jgi:hypothetical protein